MTLLAATCGLLLVLLACALGLVLWLLLARLEPHHDAPPSWWEWEDDHLIY